MKLQYLQQCEGLIGLKVAGKGMFGRHLAEKYGFTVLVTSDAIRKVCIEEEGILRPSTTDLQNMGDKRKLEFGAGYWMKMLLRMSEEQQIQKLVIDGIRNPAEVYILSQLLGERFSMKGIVAPYERRLEWFLGRKKEGDVMDPDWFRMMDERDRGIGQPEHGQQVGRTLEMVPPRLVYNNIGSREDALRWLDWAMGIRVE
jgi:dephospho-CoA kinase